MAIKRVWIEDNCVACGLCEDICPDVFKIDEEVCIIEGINYSDYEEQILEAVDNCIVEIIKYSN